MRFYPLSSGSFAKGTSNDCPAGDQGIVYSPGIRLTRPRGPPAVHSRGRAAGAVELGRLLKEASEGRTRRGRASVARLLDEDATVAEWDVSTRQTKPRASSAAPSNPPSATSEVRKVRGPILDKLYTRLKRCGDLSSIGKPFTEHRNVPALTIDRDDPRPTWRQVGETLAKAIRSGNLAPGRPESQMLGFAATFRNQPSLTTTMMNLAGAHRGHICRTP